MGLRAPRVAYVLPCGEDWHINTRVALHEITRLWGGLASWWYRHRTGLVFDSAPVEQKLNRPFTRIPSLTAWAQSRAGIYDMRTQLSAAGAQAELLQDCSEDVLHSPNWRQGHCCQHSKPSTPQGLRANPFQTVRDAWSATKAF